MGMTDHRPTLRPAASYCVHLRHRPVRHNHVGRVHVVVLGEKLQELFNKHLIVPGQDSEGDGAADAIAILDEQS